MDDVGLRTRYIITRNTSLQPIVDDFLTDIFARCNLYGYCVGLHMFFCFFVCLRQYSFQECVASIKWKGRGDEVTEATRSSSALYAFMRACWRKPTRSPIQVTKTYLVESPIATESKANRASVSFNNGSISLTPPVPFPTISHPEDP